VRRADEFLRGDLPLHRGDADLDKELLIGERRAAALDAVASVQTRWQWLLDNLDLPLSGSRNAVRRAGHRVDALRNRAAMPTLFHRLQDYSLRVSWKSELKPQLEATSSTASSIARSSNVSPPSTRRRSAQPPVRRAAHARR
jgi:hypothetical protein